MIEAPLEYSFWKMDILDSSNIKMIGYQADIKTLYIQFMSGGVYAYDGVEQKLVDEFTNSKSKGGFFFKNIRDKFKTTKLPKLEPTRPTPEIANENSIINTEK